MSYIFVRSARVQSDWIKTPELMLIISVCGWFLLNRIIIRRDDGGVGGKKWIKCTIEYNGRRILHLLSNFIHTFNFGFFINSLWNNQRNIFFYSNLLRRNPILRKFAEQFKWIYIWIYIYTHVHKISGLNWFFIQSNSNPLNVRESLIT